jgi:hypothetical protein
VLVLRLIFMFFIDNSNPKFLKLITDNTCDMDFFLLVWIFLYYVKSQNLSISLYFSVISHRYGVCKLTENINVTFYFLFFFFTHITLIFTYLIKLSEPVNLTFLFLSYDTDMEYVISQKMSMSLFLFFSHITLIFYIFN